MATNGLEVRLVNGFSVIAPIFKLTTQHLLWQQMQPCWSYRYCWKRQMLPSHIWCCWLSQSNRPCPWISWFASRGRKSDKKQTNKWFANHTDMKSRYYCFSHWSLLELARSDLQMTPRKFWGLHKLLLAKKTLTVSVKKHVGTALLFK